MVVVALAALATTGGASVWSARMKAAAPAAAQAGAPVRLVAPDGRMPGTPGRKGDTHYWLEGRSLRVTARYTDGSSVVAERGLGGEVIARVRDAAGNEDATLAARSQSVQFTPAGRDPIAASNDSGERPTLAWAGRQAYTLARHGRSKLTWRGGLMRTTSAPDVDAAELDTEWADGLTAKLTRRSDLRFAFTDHNGKRRVFEGPAVVSRLTRDGVKVGASVWYPNLGVFLWNLPGLSSGYMEPGTLAAYGGWPFTPDLEWVNLQTIAFYYFKTALKTPGGVARADGGGTRGLVSRITNFFAPTVSANDAGCDMLHWLDGTILRYCCDMHDACYEQASSKCTWKSWWHWLSSWTCTQCNVQVIFCFEAYTCEPWCYI
jgi:hypothetical protein